MRIELNENPAKPIPIINGYYIIIIIIIHMHFHFSLSSLTLKYSFFMYLKKNSLQFESACACNSRQKQQRQKGEKKSIFDLFNCQQYRKEKISFVKDYCPIHNWLIIYNDIPLASSIHFHSQHFIDDDYYTVFLPFNSQSTQLK